jgi:translation elongation factor EF-4
MGYVRFGLRDTRQAMPGTVLIPPSQLKNKDLCLPIMPDVSSTKSALYASVHPADADGFEALCDAVDRLALNDTGLEVSRTSSLGNATGGPFLGPGLRVGFQGLLHVEVFRQRLEDEFEVQAVVTPPKVTYRVTSLPGKNNNLEESVTRLIEDLKEWVSSFRPCHSSKVHVSDCP